MALGTLQQERSPLYALVLVTASAGVFALQSVSGWREARKDRGSALQLADGDVDVGKAVDIPDGRAISVVLSGEHVAVFRKGRRICAVSAVCRHQNGPLGEGRIVDGLITCPWHGYQYRPEDGIRPEIRPLDKILAAD